MRETPADGGFSFTIPPLPVIHHFDRDRIVLTVPLFNSTAIARRTWQRADTITDSADARIP